ncbi:MAG: hypothetical protein QOE33_2347 [Acidobacteriota bacterium]|nr:hypothetical protein [Acidobacteriota bacterium]
MRLLTDAGYAEELDILVDELIDQYVAGDFSAEEREQLEQYFFKSPERRDKLRFALTLKKRRQSKLLSHGRWTSRELKFYLPLAACVLLVMGMGFGVWQASLRRPELGKGLIALRSAYREQRPIEARISDFGYARVEGERGEGERFDHVQRDLAAALLLDEPKQHPSVESYRAAGQYYLATRRFDDAVVQFKAALNLDPRDAKAHSDLGATLLEEGKLRLSGAQQGSAAQAFGESLEHLTKALELDNSLLEALFNRALVYQYMPLPNKAAEDWRTYLARDPNSKWAGEARENLKTLEEQRERTSRREGQSLLDFYKSYDLGEDAAALQSLSRNYTSAGNTITNSLVDSYLDAEIRGDDSAAGRELHALEYAGRLESQKSGDGYTSDIARFYSQLNPTRCRSLAQAREEMKRGYEQYLKSNLDEASGYYAHAKSMFDEAGSEGESTFAEYLNGLCYVLRFDNATAEPLFKRLLVTCEDRKYTWLLGQSLYRSAMLKLHANKYSESIADSQRALETLERINDVNGTIKVLIMLADEYQSLNDVPRSLGFIQRGLSLAGEGQPEPLQMWGMYTAMAFNFSSLELNAAALECEKEALRLASELGRPLLIARSHSYLAMSYADLKHYDEALAHVGLALDTGSSLSGETSGREMLAHASLYAGEIYRRRGDNDKAIEAYDRAINFYAGQDFPYFRYTAHKGKLLALLARNEDQSVGEELRTVMSVFEQYRVELTEENQRNVFFDVEQGVYDRVMDFAYTRKHDSDLALDYSELSRARSLLDAMHGGAQVSDGEDAPESRLLSASAPLTAAELPQRMPEHAQAVEYAALDDKLLIWVVTRAGISTEVVAIGSSALEEKVRAYLRAVNGTSEDDEREARRRAGELYDILIKPVESHLDKTKLLCIVPDKILHFLPYAALVSPAGKYLVEDFRLEVSPSSSVFVECSEGAKLKANRDEEKLLSIGNPNFDPRAFPSLSPLPSAGKEARAIAASYKSPRLLIGDDAREELIKSEIKKSDVANFALHYVVNPQSAMLSGMLLTRERGGDAPNAEDGVLRIQEIYKLKLPQTRLVVLSACQTGIEQEYRGEGAIGVARAFIAAGVPIVVASLWSVDSASTARLMISFHVHRKRDQQPTAEALKQAQLELIRGDDGRFCQPRYWAAFTAIGGYTEF